MIAVKLVDWCAISIINSVKSSDKACLVNTLTLKSKHFHWNFQKPRKPDLKEKGKWPDCLVKRAFTSKVTSKFADIDKCMSYIWLEITQKRRIANRTKISRFQKNFERANEKVFLDQTKCCWNGKQVCSAVIHTNNGQPGRWKLQILCKKPLMKEVIYTPPMESINMSFDGTFLLKKRSF